MGPVQGHTAKDSQGDSASRSDGSMGFVWEWLSPSWRSGSLGVYGWSVSEGKGQEATSDEKLFGFCLSLLLSGSETSENWVLVLEGHFLHELKNEERASLPLLTRGFMNVSQATCPTA